jgi:hypothetical protein
VRWLSFTTCVHNIPSSRFGLKSIKVGTNNSFRENIVVGSRIATSIVPYGRSLPKNVRHAPLPHRVARSAFCSRQPSLHQVLHEVIPRKPSTQLAIPIFIGRIVYGCHHPGKPIIRLLNNSPGCKFFDSAFLTFPLIAPRSFWSCLRVSSRLPKSRFDEESRIRYKTQHKQQPLVAVLSPTV